MLAFDKTMNCCKQPLEVKLLQPPTIKSAWINQEMVQVTFADDNSTHSYPFLFLQHHCTCASCFHPSSHSTLRQITDLDPSNHVVSLTVSQDHIRCKWKNDHESTFNHKWLKERRFTEDNWGRNHLVPRDFPEYVGPESVLGKMEFEELFLDDQKLLRMLETVSRQGVCLLENAPCRTGQLRRLAEKIGFIRLTHYGLEFTVKSNPNPINLAYTSKRLGFHTDLPYLTSPPGVQLLHCIVQYEHGRGGETQLVDGFRVALQMKQHYPDEFRILSTVPLEFCDVGKDYTSFYKVHRTPLFVCDDNGKLVRVAYSSHVLSSFMPLRLDQVKPMYEALMLFMKLCYSSNNLIEFKLKAGEIMIFDNWRMLHGREGFDPTKGQRHLEGCYVDWDEINCRIRVIKNNL